MQETRTATGLIIPVVHYPKLTDTLARIGVVPWTDLSARLTTHEVPVAQEGVFLWSPITPLLACPRTKDCAARGRPCPSRPWAAPERHVGRVNYHVAAIHAFVADLDDLTPADAPW